MRVQRGEHLVLAGVRGAEEGEKSGHGRRKSKNHLRRLRLHSLAERGKLDFFDAQLGRDELFIEATLFVSKTLTQFDKTLLGGADLMKKFQCRVALLYSEN